MSIFLPKVFIFHGYEYANDRLVYSFKRRCFAFLIASITGKSTNSADNFLTANLYFDAEKLQTWARQGSERWAVLGLWIYSMVWLWFCQQPSAKRTFLIQPGYARKLPQASLTHCDPSGSFVETANYYDVLEFCCK